MMTSKLNLDFSKVTHAKQSAQRIATDVQHFVDGYTTVAVERTLCRLIGIDGVDENLVPLPNVVVEAIHEAGRLS
ncbi:MAG: D-lysine 5,6-aminomutase subunit alpha, partial [Bacteroidales bacterium]|nr:D-lysine 5,6-aminomutase subunit alpha [Bacteroidales bacterium]